MFEDLADPSPVTASSDHLATVVARADRLRQRRRAMVAAVVVVVLAPLAFLFTQSRTRNTDVVSVEQKQRNLLPSLSATTSPPGTSLFNGFEVPSGTRQIGPALPVAGGWQAMFLVDEHAAKVFDSVVAQAAELGFVVLPSGAPAGTTPVSGGSDSTAGGLSWSDDACRYGVERGDGTVAYDVSVRALEPAAPAVYVRCATEGYVNTPRSAPTIEIFVEQGRGPGQGPATYFSHARLTISGAEIYEADGFAAPPSGEPVPMAPNRQVPDIVGPGEMRLAGAGEVIIGTNSGLVRVLPGSELVAPLGTELVAPGVSWSILLLASGDPIGARDAYLDELQRVVGFEPTGERNVADLGWREGWSVTQGRVLDGDHATTVTLFVPPAGPAYLTVSYGSG